MQNLHLAPPIPRTEKVAGAYTNVPLQSLVGFQVSKMVGRLIQHEQWFVVDRVDGNTLMSGNTPIWANEILDIRGPNPC